MKTNTLFW